MNTKLLAVVAYVFSVGENLLFVLGGPGVAGIRPTGRQLGQITNHHFSILNFKCTLRSTRQFLNSVTRAQRARRGSVLNRYWVAAAAWGCLVHCALAAAPSIARVDPPAAVAGGTTEITFVGDNLDGGLDVWTSFPCEVSPGERPGAPVFRLTIAGKVPRGLGALRLITTNGISNPQLFLIDSLPTASSGGTNHSLATARKVTVPGAFHGVCEEVRSDFYKLGARKGDRLTMEIVAQRTGSALDPVLRLLDTRGLELAANDDTPELGGDARLEFRCPKTGEYIVEVRDTRDGRLDPGLILVEEEVRLPLLARIVCARGPRDAEHQCGRQESQRGKSPGHGTGVRRGRPAVLLTDAVFPACREYC